MAKVHKGEITNWRKVIAAKGFVIHGTFAPAKIGKEKEPRAVTGYTGRVFTHNEETGEIETADARYRLSDV
jgi:hypothetical protein